MFSVVKKSWSDKMLVLKNWKKICLEGGISRTTSFLFVSKSHVNLYLRVQILIYFLEYTDYFFLINNVKLLSSYNVFWLRYYLFSSNQIPCFSLCLVVNSATQVAEYCGVWSWIQQRKVAEYCEVWSFSMIINK